jgi:Ca-activated chloride channel homolog
MKFLLRLILVIFLSVFAIKAQKPIVSPTPPTAENEVCGLTSPEIATLNVSVWSKNKGYLKGLNYKDFEVFDGKERQDIEFFWQKDEPISVGILFDLSDSIQSFKGTKISEIPFAIEGIFEFINKSNPKNEYFFTGFSNKISVLLEPTQDAKKIEETLKSLVFVKTDGNTAVYDAINSGLEKISNAKFERKILFVISDGLDNNSKKSFEDIVKRGKQSSDVKIYFINLVTDDEKNLSEDLLRSRILMDLVENSGGQGFYINNLGQVIKTFQSIADELKNQYTIGFTPKYSRLDKKDWHEIKVNLNLPKEKKKETGKIIIRSQKGFYF